MKRLDRLYNLWRRQFGTFQLDDPRPTAIEDPYTFYLPGPNRLAAIDAGDLVQIVLRSIPKGVKYAAERLWFKVLDVSEDNILGSLESQPIDIPQLVQGRHVKFQHWHVIDCSWKDPNKEDRFPFVPTRQRWDRCLVDSQIVHGAARVGSLYREEVDMTQDGDKHPDSGWRIRAEVDDLTEDEYENPDPVYIALGKVLNKDDSWLHLIDAPIGTAYERNLETGLFEEVEFTADRESE